MRTAETTEQAAWNQRYSRDLVGLIAVARALSDLAHHVLHAAAADVEGMTHERAHLHL